jgi:hypothetical protein
MTRFRVFFGPQTGRSATTITADTYELDNDSGVLQFVTGTGQQRKIVRVFSAAAEWWEIEPLIEGQP